MGVADRIIVDRKQTEAAQSQVLDEVLTVGTHGETSVCIGEIARRVNIVIQCNIVQLTNGVCRWEVFCSGFILIIYTLYAFPRSSVGTRNHLKAQGNLKQIQY